MCVAHHLNFNRLLSILPQPTGESGKVYSIRKFRDMFSSNPSPPSTPLLPIRSNPSQYRVAYQERNGCAILHELELMEDDPGSDVMRKLRAKSKEIMSPSRPFGFIWKVVIETAIAEPVGSPLSYVRYID